MKEIATISIGIGNIQQRPWPQVLRVHETGRGRNPPHQEIRFRDSVTPPSAAPHPSLLSGHACRGRMESRHLGGSGRAVTP